MSTATPTLQALGPLPAPCELQSHPPEALTPVRKSVTKSTPRTAPASWAVRRTMQRGLGLHCPGHTAPLARPPTPATVEFSVPLVTSSTAWAVAARASAQMGEAGNLAHTSGTGPSQGLGVLGWASDDCLSQPCVGCHCRLTSCRLGSVRSRPISELPNISDSYARRTRRGFVTSHSR